LKSGRRHVGTRSAEILVADIGSTVTKLSAFAGLERPAKAGARARPAFLGQGIAITSTDEGDIGLGLNAARRDLESRYAVDTVGVPLMAASSAAGGLRMTVHGLTRDMTLRAAREASLGAGAIVTFATAGRIGAHDLERIRSVAPNLILLAGGVDYGEREIVLANTRRLARLGADARVIYAGNAAIREEVQQILDAAGVIAFSVDNVYPYIDRLNVAPVRALIQEVFARHIVTAPGMERLKSSVIGDVMPTPGAVMRATEVLAEKLGDVMCIDVGGATTDVHSVTEGSPRYRGLRVAPEPRSKRTVEGDLGVYVNAAHIVEAAEASAADLGDLVPIPENARERRIAVDLARWAADIAVWRHAGTLRVSYGAMGRSELVEGRDLTAIGFLVGTGGPLARLGGGEEILASIRRDPRGRKLLPPPDARRLVDRHYVMSAAGVLSQQFPEHARAILLDSVGLSDEVEGNA
jgi:uncharacterized protein (TIGR01319 family)